MLLTSVRIRILLGAALILLGSGLLFAQTGPAGTPAGKDRMRAAAAPLRIFDDALFRETASVALPEPTITEPFAIGEALYQRDKVASAVVSLLDLMGVGIVTNDGKPLRPARRKQPAPFQLTESDVRALIALGEEDADQGGENDKGPFSFKDLYRAVSPMLPGVSIDKLAGAYSEAYEKHPDDLAPKVMMGQPIEPDTPLMRTQFWLLLVDGFAPPVGTKRAAQFVLAAYQIGSGVPAWGTAAAMLPQLPSPDPRWSLDDWTYLIGVLPMVAWRTPLTVSTTGAAHEGHGGPGASVSLEARLGMPASVILSPTSGRPLLIPRLSGLGGRAIRFKSPDQALLEEHGTITGTLDAPMQTDPAGIVRLGYSPRQEKAKGKGIEVNRTAVVEVRVNAWDFLSSHYDLPLTLKSFVPGDFYTVASIDVGWHDLGALEIIIINIHDVGFNLGSLGNAKRKGAEGVEGTLTPDDDGMTYRGIVRSGTFGSIAMQGLQGTGVSCSGNVEEYEMLSVIARPIPDLGPNFHLSDVKASEGRPDGGFLRLEFYPAGKKQVKQTFSCSISGDTQKQFLNPGHVGLSDTSDPLYPFFNDFLWAHPEAGLPIAIPEKNTLHYKDDSRNTAAVGRSIWEVFVAKPE